jgi:periplasmic copper chaperone A
VQKRSLAWPAACLAFLALLGGAAAHAETPAPLVVEDAWVRALPGADVAAAYMTLHNPGSRAVTVIGVRSSVAGAAMIHETRIEHGESTMRPRERLPVPPGASVRLAPDGLHVMLHMLRHPLAVGEAVPLELLLEGGATVAVTARVKPLSAE